MASTMCPGALYTEKNYDNANNTDKDATLCNADYIVCRLNQPKMLHFHVVLTDYVKTT